ncbi:hypothetical protein ABIE69_003051 [Rhodobacteraceae bacterium MBR-64]
MREQIGRTVQTDPLPRGHGLTEVFGVPVDNDGGEQVETGHAIVLTLGRAIPDFALASDAQSVFQCVMRLALVQADLIWAPRCMSASRSHSMMKRVRSTRPISRSVVASSCWRG